MVDLRWFWSLREVLCANVYLFPLPVPLFPIGNRVAQREQAVGVCSLEHHLFPLGGTREGREQRLGTGDFGNLGQISTFEVKRSVISRFSLVSAGSTNRRAHFML